MHLIPLDETIYYNATMVDYSFLSTIVLLSFAYHPSYSNIIYLFYGSTSSPPPGKTYSFHLLIRDSNTGSFLQNVTITQGYGCAIACEIDVTEKLLLIESESLIGIYPIKSGFQIQVSPIVNSPKVGLTQLYQIHRWAGISGPNFLVILDKDNCMFGSYSSAGSGYTSSFSHQMAYNATDILFAGISQNRTFFAVNSTSVALVYYSCLSCALGGSLTGLSGRNSLIILTGAFVPGGYRMYEGAAFSSPSIPDGIIYWTYSGGFSWKYLVNSNDYDLVENYNNYSAILTTANREYYLLVGSDESVNFRSFEQVNKEDEYNIYSYSGYGGISTSVSIVKLSWDSQLVGSRTLTQSWRLHLFQLTDTCQNYNATVNNFTNLFCDCHLYYDNGRCVLIQTDGSSGSFGLAAIVGLVAGVVVVAVSVIIVKKNYRSCVKGMKRTPYVYHPTELMSFEV